MLAVSRSICRPFASVSSSPSSPPPPTEPYAQDDAGLSPVAQQILNDVNQARTDNGLAPLALSPLLTQAAQFHVDDVVANGNWGHYGSDGSNVQMRVARVGYSSHWVSENWVAVADPSGAIVWWMNDWIHRVNILAPYWDEIGVGAAQAGNGWWILVTDFGNVDGQSSFVAATPENDALAATAVESVPAGGLDYAVRAGDTLLAIAYRFGLDWQDVAVANGMGENDLLQIGQVLHLPSVGGIGGPVSADLAATVAVGKQTYPVRAGDTLLTIALRYGVTWQEIAAVNGMGEFDLLQIGDELKLPASADAGEVTAANNGLHTESGAGTLLTAAQQSSSGEDAGSGTAAVEGAAAEERPAAKAVKQAALATPYVVQSGDTLLAVALRHGVTLADLSATNDLGEDDLLQIGQELTIPGLESAAGLGEAGERSRHAGGGGCAGNGPRSGPRGGRQTGPRGRARRHHLRHCPAVRRRLAAGIGSQSTGRRRHLAAGARDPAAVRAQAERPLALAAQIACSSLSRILNLACSHIRAMIKVSWG